jgi:hypothetical protein
MPRPDRLRDALVSLVLAVVPAACLAALAGPSQPRPDPSAGGCPLVHCPGDARCTYFAHSAELRARAAAFDRSMRPAGDIMPAEGGD